MPQRPFHHFTARLALAGLALVVLCSCGFFQAKPFVDEAAYKTNPPRTLAILPTTDASDHPWAAEPMRRALFSAVAPLPYQDRTLKETDEFLARKAARLECKPEQIPAEALVDAKLADCVLYSQIESISRLYLILYAHYRLELSVVLVDTRNRHVLYRNRFVFYNQSSSPVYSLFSIYDLIGVLTSSVQSLWHLRPYQLQETLEEGAQDVAKGLPAPIQELPEGKQVKFQDIKITLPDQVLGPERHVVVEARGTAHGTASFSIGKIAHDVPMDEDSPGHYVGHYTVKKGDNTPYAVVELQLKAAVGSETLEYTANEYPFAIDTMPPPRARLAHWWYSILQPGVYLAFEQDPRGKQKDNEDPLEYYVYRRPVGHTKYEGVGISPEPAFHDTRASRGAAYDYYVITRDQAGNFSRPWDVVRVQEKPGQK